MQAGRKKEIRIQAAQYRENCKISRYGILDLFKECERSGYKLFRYPIGEEAALGFTMKKDQDKVIFTNTSSRLSREIFTLAHEIGHIQLHMDGNFKFIDDSNSISSKSKEEKEQESNYFAACLLMPDDEVDRFFDLELFDSEKKCLSALDIARIMSEFNVSFEMALNRLEDLKKIDTAQKICLDNEKTKYHVGRLLQRVSGNARLNTATNEIVIPHEYIEYTIYNFNHNAVPEETLYKVLEYYQLGVEDIRDELIEEKRDADADIDELLGGLED